MAYVEKDIRVPDESASEARVEIEEIEAIDQEIDGPLYSTAGGTIITISENDE